MKLLLDEMWSRHIAEELRRRQHDVVAVTERDDLQSQPDEIVFAVAQAEARAIVTENVPDFRPLGFEALQRGQSHPGLIFTTNRRYPRADPRTAGRVVIALDDLLQDATIDLTDREHWL